MLCILFDNLQKSDSNTYNISSENVLSILEIAQIIKTAYEKRYSKSIEIEIGKNGASKKNKSKKKKYKISNKKIRNLGFKPNLSSTLNEILPWDINLSPLLALVISF